MFFTICSEVTYICCGINNQFAAESSTFICRQAFHSMKDMCGAAGSQPLMVLYVVCGCVTSNSPLSLTVVSIM